jgi:Right handed beta helix region
MSMSRVRAVLSRSLAKSHPAVRLTALAVAVLLVVLLGFMIVRPADRPTSNPASAPARTAAPKGTSPSATTPPGTLPPASIASDCSDDVSAALSDWIASLPDSSTVTFPAGACYLVPASIRLTERKGLTFNGNGATFKRTRLSPPKLRYPNPNPYWWILGGSNLTFNSMSIVGTNTKSDLDYEPAVGAYKVEYEFEAAFRAEGTRDFVADRIIVDAVWGDGFQLQGGSGATITNSNISRNGRQGITGADISNIRLAHNTITLSRRAGIDLENNVESDVVTGVEIHHNTIGAIHLALAAGGPGAVNGVYFHDNTITTSGVPFIYNQRKYDGAVRRRDWRIENNVVQQELGSPLAAILMNNTDNVTITGNTVPIQKVWDGITPKDRRPVDLINSAGRLVVRNNDFRGARISYVADRKTGSVDACGNKLIASGGFDEPTPCS